MKNKFLIITAVFIIIASCTQKSNDPVDYVNSNIGGHPPLLQPTVPLVSLPNSMMRIHGLPGGYQAEKISGFLFILYGHRCNMIFLIFQGRI